MFDGNMREQVDRGVQPVGAALVNMGITADVMTIVGIGMSAVAAVVIGSGNLGVGLVLMILTGLPDLLDGAIAKAAGTSSMRGAYFDSVSDRLTDIMLFSGVAWHLSATREDQMHMLPVAIMGLAVMISYQRAKAESLGFDAKGGLMERARAVYRARCWPRAWCPELEPVVGRAVGHVGPNRHHCRPALLQGLEAGQRRPTNPTSWASHAPPSAPRPVGPDGLHNPASARPIGGKGERACSPVSTA